MYDTDLHLLLGADEVGGDVMVAGHYHTCCCCSNRQSVFSPVFRVGSLFLADMLLDLKIYIALFLGHLSVISVDRSHKCGEVLNT